MSEPVPVPQSKTANAALGIRHVFVRDLVIETEIGVTPKEKYKPQRIVINVDLAVREVPVRDTDAYSDVVCYDDVTRKVRALAAQGHVNLVETLAERIAAACLEDERVISARVRIEKPDIFDDCASVGIEIERMRS